MKRIKKELHKTHENTEVQNVKDNEFNALLLLTKESRFELKARTGTLECFDKISKKIISVKFSKTSEIYRLLSGYSMLKDAFKKSRFIAVEIDSKENAAVLKDKKLKALEKKYLSKEPWYLVHNNTFGIGA